MLYREPFVLYLNISVCIILLFLMLPSLLNRREELKVRLAFSLIFFTVIANCTTNVLILLLENHHLVPVVFMAFFIPLLFGPAVFYYVKTLLGSSVGRGIYLTVLPGIASFCYGLYRAFADSLTKQQTLRKIIAGEHTIFNIANLLSLIFIIVYCIKAWLFLQKLTLSKKDRFYLQTRLKKAWAKEFTVYIFVPVFIFSILHAFVLAGSTPVTTMDMDLIWMPVFMLFVYLLIAIRNLMMYKEFEHQFVLARIESEKQIQEQRLEIARDLHDSLGAQLTFIASVSDGIKRNAATGNEHLRNKADTLTDFTENAISELKNALWVLNTEVIRLEDLKNKLLNFVKAAGEAREEVRFHFEFSLEENLPVDSKWAVNLFRMVQEIINNAAKYAQAEDVWIKAVQSAGTLRLEIKDNGIGFDRMVVKGKSFGLSNLQQRVQTMNGKFQVESEKGKGTHYFIEIPLQ